MLDTLRRVDYALREQFVAYVDRATEQLREDVRRAIEAGETSASKPERQ
jgi:hypothetical protein